MWRAEVHCGILHNLNNTSFREISDTSVKSATTQVKTAKPNPAPRSSKRKESSSSTSVTPVSSKSAPNPKDAAKRAEIERKQSVKAPDTSSAKSADSSSEKSRTAPTSSEAKGKLQEAGRKVEEKRDIMSDLVEKLEKKSKEADVTIPNSAPASQSSPQKALKRVKALQRMNSADSSSPKNRPASPKSAQSSVPSSPESPTHKFRKAGRKVEAAGRMKSSSQKIRTSASSPKSASAPSSPESPTRKFRKAGTKVINEKRNSQRQIPDLVGKGKTEQEIKTKRAARKERAEEKRITGIKDEIDVKENPVEKIATKATRFAVDLGKNALNPMAAVKNLTANTSNAFSPGRTDLIDVKKHAGLTAFVTSVETGNYKNVAQALKIRVDHWNLSNTWAEWVNNCTVPISLNNKRERSIKSIEVWHEGDLSQGLNPCVKNDVQNCVMYIAFNYADDEDAWNRSRLQNEKEKNTERAKKALSAFVSSFNGLFEKKVVRPCYQVPNEMGGKALADIPVCRPEKDKNSLTDPR